jgi:hypothetical protein
MSALETTVRVSSEKQTLILAGEPVPQRRMSLAGRSFADPDSQLPLTVVVTPVDDPTALETAAVARNLASAGNMPRGNPRSAAGAYLRTQELSWNSTRSALIDTYA